MASVSVWFRRKERPRNGIFGFGRVKNRTRAIKWNRGGGGEGKEGNASRQIPGFWKPARQRAGFLIGLANRTLLRCVDQKFVSYWEVVTRIIFCGYCLFWLACSRLRDGGKSRSVKRNAKNARELGRDTAVTAYFSKSCASYFRFARFNTSPPSESLVQANSGRQRLPSNVRAVSLTSFEM